MKETRKNHHTLISQALVFCVIFLAFLGCESTVKTPPSLTDIAAQKPVMRDLDAIRAEGVLRLITRNNSNSYFLLRGAQFGFEYDLAKRFAEKLDLKLEVVTPQSWGEMIASLNAGHGDIIGANFEQVSERQKLVAFISPWREEDLVLVTHQANGVVSDPMQLAGMKIFLRQQSPAEWALDHWRRMFKGSFQVEYIADDLEVDGILQGIAAGRYEATVVPRHTAELEKTHTKHLAIGASISKRVPIGWAVRRNSRALKKELDLFVEKTRPNKFFRIINRKYFGDSKRLARQRRQETYTLVSGALSPHDVLIKMLSNRYDFDWRLIGAVMFQESRFDPTLESWAGAKGLMQLMPNTAKTLRMDCYSSNYNNIHCGVKLLSDLRKLFAYIDDSERMNFVLAAYNAGLGHVRDAQHLAIDTGHNPLVWDGHVENMIGRLAVRRYYRTTKHGYCNGPQVISYVRSIRTLFKSYSQILPSDKTDPPLEGKLKSTLAKQDSDGEPALEPSLKSE